MDPHVKTAIIMMLATIYLALFFIVTLFLNSTRTLRSDWLSIYMINQRNTEQGSETVINFNRFAYIVIS